MFRREVKPLGEVLQRFLREEGLEQPLLQRRLLASWDNVVGESVARYTGEKYIRNQTLYVRIVNPALRQDLSMTRSQLVKRLNGQAGGLVITDVRLY